MKRSSAGKNGGTTEVVYDILDCGPRNRFVANGKLVHNSGGDKQNTTNMNRVDPRDPTSGALRMSLEAPDGQILVVRDLSQIETRTAAYWAGQEDLLDLFRAGGDPYNRQASLIFGYEVDRKLEEFYLEGLAGKAAVLGCTYGLGWFTFQENLRKGFMGMPPLVFTEADARKMGADVEVFKLQRSYMDGFANLEEQALSAKPLNMDAEPHLWHCTAVKQIVDKYRSSNAAIKSLWAEMGRALPRIIAGESVAIGRRPLVTTHKDGLMLPNGMLIRYYSLEITKDGQFKYNSNVREHKWSYVYGGLGVENVNQALARIILTDQMLRIDQNLKDRKKVNPGKIYKVITSTYDEVVCCVPEGEEDWCNDMMGVEMATPPEWCSDLPLKSAGGYAKSYGDCEH